MRAGCGKRCALCTGRRALSAVQRDRVVRAVSEATQAVDLVSQARRSAAGLAGGVERG